MQRSWIDGAKHEVSSVGPISIHNQSVLLLFLETHLMMRRLSIQCILFRGFNPFVPARCCPTKMAVPTLLGEPAINARLWIDCDFVAVHTLLPGNSQGPCRSMSFRPAIFAVPSLLFCAWHWCVSPIDCGLRTRCSLAA